MIGFLALLILRPGAIVLPEPSGPYPIGTRVFHLVDHARADPVHPALPREIMIQCWYPATRKGNSKARYIPDTRLVHDLAKAGYYGQTAEQLETWGWILTHADLNASVRRGRHLPVLLLEPGLGMPRSNYTIYAEDLASRGYFIASIDPPYGGETTLPDGRRLSAGDDPVNGDPLKFPLRVHDWALDARFVLDALAGFNRAGSKSPIAGRLDLTAVGMFGHSMGGSAALEATFVDPRIRAAIDLDGQPVGESISKGLRVPSLAIRSDPNYSDADLAKLGRTRQQWTAMGENGRVPWDELGQKSKAPAISAAIRDTGHLSYSDAPFVMPSTITRFSSHSLDPAKTLRVTLRLIDCFFGSVLLGRKCPLLDGRSQPIEGVTVTHASPKPGG